MQFSCCRPVLTATLRIIANISLKTNHKLSLGAPRYCLPHTEKSVKTGRPLHRNYFSGTQAKSEAWQEEKHVCDDRVGQRLKTSALTSWTFYHLLYVPPYLNDFLLNCAAVPPHYGLNMYRHSRWFKNSCKCLWKNMWNVLGCFRRILMTPTAIYSRQLFMFLWCGNTQNELSCLSLGKGQ